MQETATARWPGLVLFKLNWLVLVLGQQAWSAAAMPVLVLQVAWLLRSEKQWLRPALCCVLLAAAGSLLDQMLALTGLYRFPTPLLPSWLVLLWLAFAVALRQLAPLLHRLPVWLACVVLAMAGIAGYGAGHWLGAVRFGVPWPLALVVVGLCWLLLWPLYRLADTLSAGWTTAATMLAVIAVLGTTLVAPRAALADTAPLLTLGQARFSLLFMPIYDARLEAPTRSFNFPGTAPYALTLTYQRDIEASRIVEATLDQWRQQGLAPPAAWQALLASTIPPVRRGDRLQLAVAGDGSARLLYNDHSLAHYDDPAFVTAFAGIWLDARTTHPAQRRQLLGESR